mmetsp:Transcript_21885/g.70470  ORF Transcript_21885/g.70470 Transcript_21885/m.70470 type:complete len:507 (+) Transcript_21885:76-1596(+)
MSKEDCGSPIEAKEDSQTPDLSGLPGGSEEEAIQWKEKGNAFFKKMHFSEAIDAYTKGIEAMPSAVLLSNRAFAYVKTEAFGLAIADAGQALELDASYPKAYYRRGSALIGLGKFQEALKDFRQAVKLQPKSKDARLKFQQCQKEVRRIKFEAAIATERTLPPSETIDVDSIAVESSYEGPVLPETGITLGFVKELMSTFEAQKLVHKRFVVRMLLDMRRLLGSMPTLVDVAIGKPTADGEGGAITVCGDTHGQYYDLLNIFKLNGLPSETNPYVFNGDFVDRGSFSVENVLTLFAFKLLYPAHVHLTRGNHETINMNKIYGFEGEVKHKYDDTVMALFTEVFQWLPAAICIDKRVLVVHGGLPQRDGVTLDDIRGLPRGREPPEEGLMSDLLWSDPQPFPGRGPSKRGVGKSFGPDVTAAFLRENGLELLIRSHEVKDEGYVVEHGGKCITVFSAPNYVDQMGNKGAMVKLSHDSSEPMFVQFSAVPHPPVKPMAYSNMGMFGFM